MPTPERDKRILEAEKKQNFGKLEEYIVNITNLKPQINAVDLDIAKTDETILMEIRAAQTSKRQLLLDDLTVERSNLANLSSSVQENSNYTEQERLEFRDAANKEV